MAVMTTTATDELRRLLDERGVEWLELSNMEGDRITRWEDSSGRYVSAFDCDDTQYLDDFYWGPTPQQAIDATLGAKITGDTSDGYHTFNELYYHRAVLFSVIVRDHREVAWKSKLHHDGTMYDGMFIVGVETPEGQATYHYDIDPYWDMFDCKELDRAPEWDGHTPSEAIERISTLGRGTCENVGYYIDPTRFECSACGYNGWTKYAADGNDKVPNYCPNCGRKVVDE